MVYQFSDPIYCALYDNTREMLFTGGWDRQLRAIDLKDNVVDQSFGASKEAIRTLHLTGKTLYIAGQEPVVRAFDLETAQIKELKQTNEPPVLGYLQQGRTGWSPYFLSAI